jgi:hypothetical protein
MSKLAGSPLIQAFGRMPSVSVKRRYMLAVRPDRRTYQSAIL